MRTLTLYTKRGCHLCEHALEALERVRADHPFRLEERDIEADETLHRAYFERIPVVALDGEEMFEYEVDEQALRKALESRR